MAKSKMPSVYWVTYKRNGKAYKTCHENLLDAQGEAAGAMMGTKIKPRIKRVTLQKNGVWK